MLKFLRLSLVVAFLGLTFFFLGGSALSQEDTATIEAYEDIPETAFAPDSPFYFLRDWQEGVERFFARSDEARANLELKHAQRRVAEIKRLTRLGETDLLEQARERWQEHMQRAEERAEQVQERQEEIRQKVLEATDKHRLVLEKVLESAPEQAQEGLQRAIDNSTILRQRLLEKFPTGTRGVLEGRLKQRLENSIDQFQLPRDRFLELLQNH